MRKYILGGGLTTKRDLLEGFWGNEGTRAVWEALGLRRVTQTTPTFCPSTPQSACLFGTQFAPSVHRFLLEADNVATGAWRPSTKAHGSPVGSRENELRRTHLMGSPDGLPMHNHLSPSRLYVPNLSPGSGSVQR